MKRILIVDDHTIVRRGLAGMLTAELIEVEIKGEANGSAARAALKRPGWDLVLLDINLPDCSGLDLLQEIHESKPRVPVIVLSAYAEQEFALHAFRLGASAYLNKQRASDELLAAVNRVLAGGRYVTDSQAELMAGNLGGDPVVETYRLLSTRELQVLGMTAEGLSQKEIAAKLSLSVKTVSTYRSRIAEKLDLHSNVELTRYALHHRLVD